MLRYRRDKLLWLMINIVAEPSPQQRKATALDATAKVKKKLAAEDGSGPDHSSLSCIFEKEQLRNTVKHLGELFLYLAVFSPPLGSPPQFQMKNFGQQVTAKAGVRAKRAP